MSIKGHILAGCIALGSIVPLATASAAPAPAPLLQAAPTAVELASHHSRLSPAQIRRIVRHQGYREVEIIRRDGRTYLVRAENYRGRDVILRVSARSGTVLSVQVIRRGRGHGWDGHGGHGGWHGGHGGWPGHGGWDDDRPRCWLPEGCR